MQHIVQFDYWKFNQTDSRTTGMLKHERNAATAIYFYFTLQIESQCLCSYCHMSL